MNKLECQVIAIPQQKRNFTLFGKAKDGQLVFTNTSTFDKIIPHQLYFISNRVSNKGDWTIFANRTNEEIISYNLPVKAICDYGTNGMYNFKVEASTDASLNLPFIPVLFLETYVLSKGDIDKILVEIASNGRAITNTASFEKCFK